MNSKFKSIGIENIQKVHFKVINNKNFSSTKKIFVIDETGSEIFKGIPKINDLTTLINNIKNFLNKENYYYFVEIESGKDIKIIKIHNIFENLFNKIDTIIEKQNDLIYCFNFEPIYDEIKIINNDVEITLYDDFVNLPFELYRIVNHNNKITSIFNFKSNLTNKNIEKINFAKIIKPYVNSFIINFKENYGCFYNNLNLKITKFDYNTFDEFVQHLFNNLENCANLLKFITKELNYLKFDTSQFQKLSVNLFKIIINYLKMEEL